MQKLVFVLLAFLAVFTLIRTIENVQAEENDTTTQIEARIDVSR